MTNDPPESVLTEKHREYLRADEEERLERYDKQTRYRRRKAIRERVEQSVFDFTLLFKHLEQDELKEIFGSDTTRRASSADSDEIAEEVHRPARTSGSMKSVFAFLARASDLDDAQVFPGEASNQPALSLFTARAQLGIETYFAQKKGILADISISLEVENLRPLETISSEDFGIKEIDRLFSTGWESPALSEEHLEIAKEKRREFISSKLEENNDGED